jgi:hypothetical protein
MNVGLPGPADETHVHRSRSVRIGRTVKDLDFAITYVYISLKQTVK